MCRRVLICRIDAQQERPDARQFIFDARQMVRDNRANLVAAGLTILRAYIVAGKPNPMPQIGSFEEWNLIREALVWLGAGDPYETSQAALEHDPRKNELVELLSAWHDCFGNTSITLAEIGEKYKVESAWDRDTYSKNPPNDKLSHLHRLLTEMGGRNTFNAKSIGHRLRRHVERVVSGMVLRYEKDSHGARWSVYKVSDVTKSGTDLPNGDEV
jgi:hypothetical protein